MQERENILRIFKEAKKAMASQDTSLLRTLSDETINTAARTQDPDNIATAVMIYSLSKLVDRPHYQKLSGWKKFYDLTLQALDRAIASIQAEDDMAFKKHIESIRFALRKISGDLRKNIESVFRKAQINKASRIYEHGISLEKTASLLGVTMWELANYAGDRTTPPPVDTSLLSARLKRARELFT